MSAQRTMWQDKYGVVVRDGDIIKMPGTPWDVTVQALVECEPGCVNGAAAVNDPETGERDEVCLGQFLVVRRADGRSAGLTT